jgi:hypothetical protein
MKKYSCTKSLNRHNKTCTNNENVFNKINKEDNKINNHSNVNIENIENIENFINIENLNLFSTENKSNEINIKEIKEKLSEINPNISVDNINVKNINLVGFDEKWKVPTGTLFPQGSITSIGCPIYNYDYFFKELFIVRHIFQKKAWVWVVSELVGNSEMTNFKFWVWLWV